MENTIYVKYRIIFTILIHTVNKYIYKFVLNFGA